MFSIQWSIAVVTDLFLALQCAEDGTGDIQFE